MSANALNRFNWRLMATAPRDGSSFVSLVIITHCGGMHRPIDITPDVKMVHRAHVTADSAGYWHTGPTGTKHGGSVGDRDLAAGWWTTIEEYAAAVPEPEATWHNAPSFVRGFICCPIVFVRPLQRNCEPDLATELEAKYGPVLEAEIVWPHGNTGNAPERWSSAKCHKLEGINPGWLDSGGLFGGALPFRWMMLSEFFPQSVFEHQVAEEIRLSAHRIDEWQRRAAARRPQPCDHLDWFIGRQLTYRLEQEFRAHLPGCAECQAALGNAT